MFLAMANGIAPSNASWLAILDSGCALLQQSSNNPGALIFPFIVVRIRRILFMEPSRSRSSLPYGIHLVSSVGHTRFRRQNPFFCSLFQRWRCDVMDQRLTQRPASCGRQTSNRPVPCGDYIISSFVYRLVKAHLTLKCVRYATKGLSQSRNLCS